MIGTINPPSSATATLTSECLKRKMRSPAQAAFAAGTRCSASASARMMKSFSESLKRGLPSRCFERGRVDLLAHRDQTIDRDVGCQIEVRDDLLGLFQPRRDGLAHAVERHFFVAGGIV